MNKLNEIYDAIQKIQKMDISDFQKMDKIHELQKKAGAETWSLNEKYRLSANSLHNYAQTQWTNIYLKTDKETQQKFEELINNAVKEAGKWSIG